jgi:hypothetical protein
MLQVCEAIQLKKNVAKQRSGVENLPRATLAATESVQSHLFFRLVLQAKGVRAPPQHKRR